MSDLRSLGYVGVGADNLDDWSTFATGLLGMQVVDRGSTSLALRMDDRRQRLFVDAEARSGPRFFGWEAEDAAALDRIAERLEAAGTPVAREPAALADQRGVRELISFADPAGNRLEVFHGAEKADAPFRPGRNISGFRTGPLGLGHAVLTVERIEAVRPFYEDVLGFRLSDYALRPFKAYFFHINERHHSLAMVETGVDGLHHVMVELFSLDDVGQGYDIALEDPERVKVTLGRHSNDFITSFYAETPSRFMMEYGWGGRSIEPQTWKPFECVHGPSLWGHERSWLPPERRAQARALRLGAAEAGERELLQVLPGNHRLSPGACPWWDAAVGLE